MKKASIREVWIFSEATHSELNSFHVQDENAQCSLIQASCAKPKSPR